MSRTMSETEHAFRFTQNLMRHYWHKIIRLTDDTKFLKTLAVILQTAETAKQQQDKVMLDLCYHEMKTYYHIATREEDARFVKLLAQFHQVQEEKLRTTFHTDDMESAIGRITDIMQQMTDGKIEPCIIIEIGLEAIQAL